MSMIGVILTKRISVATLYNFHGTMHTTRPLGCYPVHMSFMNHCVYLLGGWRKLLNKELHDLYSSPSILGIIRSWRMGWAGHVVRMR
jgi:hypothetical protein